MCVTLCDSNIGIKKKALSNLKRLISHFEINKLKLCEFNSQLVERFERFSRTK